MIALNIPDNVPPRDEPRRNVTHLLCHRIFMLIEKHPEILKMSTPAVLISFPEFDFIDLNPTLAEVALALEIAIRAWKSHQDLEKP